MTAIDRPRRSMLYMPGSNARALDKGRSLPCDAIIFDLEDAVAVEAKETARTQIADALTAGGYGDRELLIRVNGLDSEWGAADLAAVATMPAHGVLVPKVESPAMVQAVARHLSDAGAPEDQSIWCMMENPLGILRAAEIAASSPRLAGFILGTNDLALDLRCRQTPDRLPFMTSFGLCILAARAHGLAIIDAVHTDLDDMDGFAEACRQGRDMGFDGKSLIHPKTIDTANALFGPSTDEVAWARKLVAAYREGQAEGKAVIVVDGQMIEDLHVREAQRLLAMADSVTTP